MQLDLHIRKTMRSGARVFQLDVRLQSDSQRMVILGPSGSGKSLTLKAIAGLLRPDAGHIRLGERVLYDAHAGIHLPPQAREIAYVFQDYALFPHLTVRQNIGFALAKAWLNPGTGVRSEAVDYWLDAFQLKHFAHQLPSELSGGQRQRTALARALVAQPRAILLDEPFAALDPALRIEMRRELYELQQRLRVPMVLITHDPEDAEVFGDHVLHLRDGVLDPKNVIDKCTTMPANDDHLLHPRHTYTRLLKRRLSAGLDIGYQNKSLLIAGSEKVSKLRTVDAVPLIGSRARMEEPS